jgi:hypothetical protein
VAWDVDLDDLHLRIWLNPDLVADAHRSFRFVAADAAPEPDVEQGLQEFLADRRFGRDVTEAEIAFLRNLHPPGRRPNKLFYYRTLQVLRDPLHFLPAEQG